MSGYTQARSSDYEASVANSESATRKQITICKIYTRRWFILGLFVIYSITNVVQWIQYSIIADVVVKYYGISYEAADWSSMVYLLLYIPFSFPGSYLLDKMGLRAAVLLGMFGTCIGAWIKVASVAPDRYWVLLTGQSIIAISEVFILPVPSRLAAVWFGPNEVSTACSLAVIGMQLGVALGFLLPPMLVDNRMEGDVLEGNLYTMAFVTAGVSSIVMLILIVFFQAAPPTPPFSAQLTVKVKKKSFLQSLKKIICNPSYVLLLTAYGINIGISYAVSILLNQIILKYHPDATTAAGRIGLVIVFSGMVGSIICGVTLDKWNRFKETALSMYALSLTAMIAFTFAVSKRIEIVYLVSALYGFSTTGFLTVGLELAVELTYPEPEGTSGGLLTISAQVMGIILTYLYSFLFNNVGDICANLVMSVVLLLGTFLIVCIRFDLQRKCIQRGTKI